MLLPPIDVKVERISALRLQGCQSEAFQLFACLLGVAIIRARGHQGFHPLFEMFAEGSDTNQA